MIGGTAYVAHRAGERSAENQMADEQQDQQVADQEARIEQLEAQQQQQAAPPPAPAAAPAAGGDDIASKLVELKGLMDQGVLTQDEFNAAKAKLLAG
jgi:Short C-terminal domain